MSYVLFFFICFATCFAQASAPSERHAHAQPLFVRPAMNMRVLPKDVLLSTKGTLFREYTFRCKTQDNHWNGVHVGTICSTNDNPSNPLTYTISTKLYPIDPYADVNNPDNFRYFMEKKTNEDRPTISVIDAQTFEATLKTVEKEAALKEAEANIYIATILKEVAARLQKIDQQRTKSAQKRKSDVHH